jgi:archaemetzincin
MQGSNSLQESDSQPIHLCPECHAKIIFATKADPVNRIDNLIRFSQEHGFNREIEFLKKAKEILKN